MSNEFGACANNLNAAIKHDSTVPEKPIIMDRHYVNGPTPLPAAAVPPPGAADIPRTNINVGSTSWNYNPYFGNFYNYYTSQTYELGDVSHQYSNQKCGAQFPCNYQQPLAPNSVLQCCDPRCQLISEQSKYPFSQALCSKSHQKAKRARGYYGGLLDIPKPDITSRPPPDYAASAKYGPMVPYPTHMNDLNNKFNSQQMPYNMQYQTAVKSSKSLFLAETTTYNNADFTKQQCWNKPNLWNPNLSSSYYPSIQQNRGVNHKFPVPLLEQNGMPSAVKHNLLHNHPPLEPRSSLYDPSYMPNYHYMNNRQNHMNNHEHRHVNEDCSYGHFPANGHQFQPAYNPHCSVVDNRQDPYYKELVLKSAETAASKQHAADKSSNLDVRQFLSTWEEGEDDKPPESEAPVIVLECSSLEGDALTKVKELGNSVTTICELGSDGNATVLKVVDSADNGIVLPKPTSVIQDSNNGRANNYVEKSTSESSQLNSDGIMTWYSNSRKRDEHSYDLVEMTERLVNSVDKLFTEPEKKMIPKTGGVLPNIGYQMPNPSVLEENYVENGWSNDFNCHKRSNDRPPQDIATNHYANDASRYTGMNCLPSNVEKSSCHFSVMNKATIKPVAGSTSAVQDYSTKFKDNYKQCPDYYQTETSNSSCQFYNSCYYAGTNLNSCSFASPAGPAGSSVNDTMTRNNNPVSYVDPASHKNSFGGQDVTQMKADLEKSLTEITSDPNSHNQKELSAVLENTAASQNSDLPKTCADLGNETSEVGAETAESAMKTTCTEIDATSHNSVIQKVGESNSTISEVNEDSGSCENSLLSMPSLSPPPTLRVPTTSNQCAESNIVADSLKTNVRSEEKMEDVNSLNEEAKSSTNVPESVGNLNQPLNLAIDKDITKLNDLETSTSKVGKAIDEKLTKEAEKKDTLKNRSADVNGSKMDDGYYSIETHFDYDNDCHKLAPNVDASSQSKDVSDGKTMPLVTQQSCIVSFKSHENKLKEFKDQILMSPCRDLNLKSKSAPPSLVNMSDIVVSEKLEYSASLMDLPTHVERSVSRQPSSENGEKSCELNSKSPVSNNDSFSEPVINIPEAKSEATRLISMKENDNVIPRQEMSPTHKSEIAPVSIESPGRRRSNHITDQELDEPQNGENNAEEGCVNSTPNACIVSDEKHGVHPEKNQSDLPNGCVTTIISMKEKLVSIESTTSRNPTKIDKNLNDLPGSNLSIDPCIEVPLTQLDSHHEVDASIRQNCVKMNGNLHNSPQRCSPVNYSNKTLPAEEKQEPTHIQAADSLPVEDLQTSTHSKPLNDSMMMESVEPPTSVIFSPHSSVHTLQGEQNDLATLGNNIAEFKLVTTNDIDGEKIHKKKFKHKRHKSKKGYICAAPYRNSNLLIDNDKSLERRSGSDSVIKENTNLLNTSHSPLYPVRSVQDLEMKLSNIRQKLPSDTLLYKCVSRTSSPTQPEYEPLKIEESSGLSACQNENELPQNSYNYNDDILISVCASNESTSSVIFENFKLGKHTVTQKNADLPVKKRKQDLIIYKCSEKPVITDHGSSHSPINYFADEITCGDKFEASFDQLKKYRRPKRRFSFTEYPEPLSCLSSSNDDVGKECRRSRSLNDWHEDENSCSDSPSKLHSLATHQQKDSHLDSRKLISTSNPCISSICEKEPFNYSISLPASPSRESHEPENLAPQSNHVSNDEFLVNDRSLLFNDNNDSLPDTSYYDYSIPSVAPTPQCDLSKEDRFESDLMESGDDSDSPQHDFRLSDTFVNSPAYNAPSTPNCDFSTNEGVNEDFTKCMSSANDVTLSGCSFNEDPASKAPSPCCMFSDVIIDEIQEPNLYQPFTVLSPASSVAPSPQCDIIDGVVLDRQNLLGTNIAECDDNNNHHTDSIDCSEPPSQVLCGVPTLQSLAFEALDGISTAPSTSNPDDGRNVLELWVTPEHTEIIIHAEDQQATTEFVVSNMDNCIETSELYEGMSISSGPTVVEIVPDGMTESPRTAHAGEDDADLHCQCIIIRNEESAIHVQCTSDSQALAMHEASLVEHTDPVVDTTYINGCTIDDEFQFCDNCIEETFIDQKLSCSPSSGSPVENEVYESSPLIEMNEAAADVSDLQMKVQLPWYKIFNLNDDLNSYDEGLLRELELGPAQIEVRLSSSGSKLWKAVNSRPEFLSSVLKVKRLVLQSAPAVNNDEQDNGSCVLSNQVESSAVQPDERLEVTLSDQEDSKRTYTVQRRPFRRGSRLNARKKTPRKRDVNGLVGVPKMVIRKTNCREYRSYLRNSDFVLPTVRLNRFKCLDELALKISTGNNGRTSININNLRAVAPPPGNHDGNTGSSTNIDHKLKAVTSPKRKASETEDRSAGVILEGVKNCPVNQVTESNAVELSNTPRLEGTEVYKKAKDAAVGVGSALFPKPSAERHHCLLCHRTYSSEELYQLHVKSKLHRHLELTQRKTIHAMYRYFTGHLCPRLRPLSLKERKKMKWKPRTANVHHFYHQKTPLQIALHKSVFHHRK